MSYGEGMNRSLRGTALDDYSKRALIHRASMHYRGIDGNRLDYADLAGLDREDLIDLILKAEYPDTGPRAEVTATMDPPPESSWPPPDYDASAWAPDDYDAQARAAEKATDYTPEELAELERLNP